MNAKEKWGITEKELTLLRLHAESVYNSIQGKYFVHALLGDLGFYDEPESESGLILHCFAIKLMQKYFGKL